MIDGSCSDAELVGRLGRIATEYPRGVDQAVNLALAFADSGVRLALPDVRTADVASTGGPSSLSTLLCPLFLRVGGFSVPKLGVPGRPAGGIDCLAQIPGYRVVLADDELRQVMEECGYAHFVAAGRFAPLDARVFWLRQLHGLQDVPVLAAASLLSKKLAVGVAVAGLDVRVAPHGNFGRTFADAQLNARMYERAAKRLGMSGRAILTDGSAPYQAYVGRSEALAALAAVFEGVADSWLWEHVELCRKLSMEAAAGESAAIASATREHLRQAFVANLAAQGASQDAFWHVATRVARGHGMQIVAEREGTVDVSLEGIRSALVAAQGAGDGENGFPDPAGVILRRRPGETVRRGEVLATVRLEGRERLRWVIQRLKMAIRVREASQRGMAI